MIRYAYELNDFRRWAGGLRKLIPQPVLRTGHLHAGITWMVIDVTLREDLTLVLLPTSPPALLLQFDLETNHPTLRLSSTGNGQESTHLRNTRIKKIALLVAPAFVRHLFRAGIRNDLLRQASRMPHPYTEPVPFDYPPLLEVIFHA